MSAFLPTDDSRRSLLARLQEELHRLGASALLALSATAHPVLYVRVWGRLVPVVVVRDASGHRWFIWGRTGQAPASHVEGAAAVLCGLEPPPARSRTAPVAARRAARKDAA
ncbi:hypothetical protein FOF52_19980 [Thermobifida alba]|uniref:Immunity protein 35 domain-containing protein n=1 Tax=Thermobifida alba TaxID=53522 RepID=A0ABY4L931_THEAE|nr:hypothetical protein [Thermobifida alba]UPT22940.1 hypothetical protein FOF52_19980 [Thermobifida alba]